MNRKVHKRRHGIAVMTFCNMNLFSTEGLYMSSRWKDVTCKKCLTKKRLI